MPRTIPSLMSGGPKTAVAEVRSSCAPANTFRLVQGWFLFLLLPRQRAVVLLDRLAEAVGHLIGSRQRQRIVVRARLAAQAELEFLHLVDRRRLQLFEAARIGVDLVGVEALEVADDVFELA